MRGSFLFDHKQVVLAAKTTRKREKEKVNIYFVVSMIDWNGCY